MKKIVAALVGGLIVFVWGIVAHVLLPIGAIGFDNLPDEAAVVDTLKETIVEPGLYYFPGFPDPATEEQQAAWQAAYEAGPRGLIVYHPDGAPPLSIPQMLTQLATSILAALVIAFVLAYLTGSYACRVALVASIGLFAWAALKLPMWNWLNFPLDYTIAALVDVVVGWLLAGLAMAKLVPRADG